MAPAKRPTALKPGEPGFIGPVSPLVNRPTSPATPAPLTEEQQNLADLMLVQGPASQPQQPPTPGGPEDLLSFRKDTTPAGQPVTLPSGTTVQIDKVRLANGLIGETTTVALPNGSPPVQSAPPGLAISPEQMAGLFATDAAYTTADRDRDLALLNGPRVQGPYTAAGLAAEAAARQAATARLEAHWDQSALPAFTDGSIVVPGLDYSAAQLANDLSLASTTGTLDERSTQLRSNAQQRLQKNAYTKQQQDNDQIAAQVLCLPVDDPKIKSLLEQGLSPAQAQNEIAQRSFAARNRLAHAEIGLLSPTQAKQLENTPRSYPTDPTTSLTRDDTPYEPKLSESSKLAQRGEDFHNLVGDLTGLNDLAEGIDDGNLGQAAWGGTMAVLTFVPGVGTMIARAAGRGIRKVGTGIANWAEKGLEAAPKALTAAEAEVAAQTTIGLSQFPIRALPGADPIRALPGGALLIPDGPKPFPADGASVGSRPGIVDYPKPEEMPWYTPGIEAPVAVAPPRTIPRGPGLRNPQAKFDEWGLQTGDEWSPNVPGTKNPRATMPRRGPGEHGNGTGVRSTPGPGIKVGVDKNGGTFWYHEKTGFRADMPPEAKVPSEVVMRGELRDTTIKTITTDLPEYEQYMLDEIYVLQNLEKAARVQADLELKGLIKDMMIKKEDGTFRELTIGDLSGTKLKSGTKLDETLKNLNGRYQESDVRTVGILAKGLSIQKGAVTGLSELRGEIGGDYFAKKAGIDIVYEGSGKYTADRVGVITDAAGNKRVVLLEYKGGRKPNSLSPRGVETGVGGEIKVEQGTLPYAQDEFLRKDSEALQALRDYDPQLAQRLLDGEDFDYLLVHTEPGTNKITAYRFDPGTAKSFHLKQPGSALMPAPAAGVGATPIAAPQWITDLMSSGLNNLNNLNNLNVWTALALPALAPLAGLAWPANTDKKVDQSMVVNISMPQPAVTDVDPREAGKVLTYGAGIR
ncbi:hypothetical protein BS297_13515 [Rhodococcus erythropolis]|uniref:Uncharacterized protein n=1 Tax=Rhodococcus erythropolis TaxID=1833 RepID=A0A5N5E356_RHOER|nr:hypothetical protein BS297_13515 [Rhodococcus erythropolis]